MKHMVIHRMGTAFFVVLIAALLLTDANAALRRGTSGVLSERSSIDGMRDLRVSFDLPAGDSSEIIVGDEAGIQAESANVAGNGGPEMKQAGEMSGEIRDFDIQAKVDTDIRAKLKAEMDKLEKNLNRNPKSQVESAAGSDGRLYLSD